jgi:beta-1,4-mannosyltransferase
MSGAAGPATAPAVPGERPLRVLQSVKQPTARTNPYIIQLAESLSAQVEVLWFSWPRGLFGRYDVFQLHWPEVMLRRQGRLQRLAALARFALLMLRLTGQRRIAVVRTLHNVGSHESGGRVERLLLAWADRLTDHWIALNPQTRAPRGGPLTVILHGDYRDWFAQYPSPASIRGTLLYFGLIRPYKGVDALLAAFARMPGDDVSLRIVGHPSSRELAALVEDAADRDHRVSALLDYVDDETLATELGRAELVVLPYQEMHNSGALLLALSLGRPALVPRTPATAALAQEVGADWVQTYDGPLTADVLTGALTVVRARAVEGLPDLSRRRWPLIADQHVSLYRELRTGLVRRPAAGRISPK